MNFESLVLAAATGDLTDEPAARESADVLEFRMDFADTPLDDLEAYEGDLEIIATNRVESQGGDAPDTPERLDTLVTAIKHPKVGAVDVELEAIADGTAGRVVEAADRQDVPVIVSAHNFSTTPPERELRGLLERASHAGDVGKAAVTATDRADVLTLLKATHDVSAAGERVSSMAMGKVGQHSRAITPLYGSCIAYAPVDPDRATAPGQYDLATLRDLLETLGAL